MGERRSAHESDLARGTRRPARARPSRRAGRARPPSVGEPLSPAAELVLRQVAEPRRRDPSARPHEHRGGTAADAVEVHHLPILVDANRLGPAPPAHELLDLVAILVREVHRGEAHPRHAAFDALGAIDLREAIGAPVEHEGKDGGATGQIAAGKHVLVVDLAGGAGARPLGAGLPLADVGVALEIARGEWGCELRHALAALQAEEALAAVGDRHREQHHPQDHHHEDPHRPRVFVARTRHLRPPARFGMGAIALREPLPDRAPAVAAEIVEAVLGHGASAWARRGRRPRSPRNSGRGSTSRTLKGPCSSAHTSAAGSTIMTPSRATLRSTTATIPKSRSIRMSEAIRAPKPAMAVAPEASTAAPVEA